VLALEILTMDTLMQTLLLSATFLQTDAAVLAGGQVSKPVWGCHIATCQLALLRACGVRAIDAQPHVNSAFHTGCTPTYSRSATSL
jgi:hypothetical protein